MAFLRQVLRTRQRVSLFFLLLGAYIVYASSAGNLGTNYAAPKLEAQRVYNLPEEPIEFAAHEPHRLNSLDLLATPNGYALLRYQRATDSKFSFMFDLTGYWQLLDAVWQLGNSEFTQGNITLDARAALGIGLAFWPWEKLRKGYIALRSQLGFQVLRADYLGDNFSYNRLIVANSLEIGVRLGRKVLSTGFFGGVGFQLPTDESTYLPRGFGLPIVYAYLGISLGLTFR